MKIVIFRNPVKTDVTEINEKKLRDTNKKIVLVNWYTDGFVRK